MVNQEESNGKLPPCVHCQESVNGSLSSPRVVFDLMVPSIFPFQGHTPAVRAVEIKLHIHRWILG